MKVSTIVGICVAVTGFCAIAGALIYFVILSPKSQDSDAQTFDEIQTTEWVIYISNQKSDWKL